MEVLKFYLSPRKIYCISHNQYSNTTDGDLLCIVGGTLFEVETLQIANVDMKTNKPIDLLDSLILDRGYYNSHSRWYFYDFYCNIVNPIQECFGITETLIRPIVSSNLHNNISKSHRNFLTFQNKEDKYGAFIK